MQADTAHNAGSEHHPQAVAQKRKFATNNLEVIVDWSWLQVVGNYSRFKHDFVRRYIEAVLEYNANEIPATNSSISRSGAMGGMARGRGTANLWLFLYHFCI